jgi:hypothetical protein
MMAVILVRRGDGGLVLSAAKVKRSGHEQGY